MQFYNFWKSLIGLLIFWFFIMSVNFWLCICFYHLRRCTDDTRMSSSMIHKIYHWSKWTSLASLTICLNINNLFSNPPEEKKLYYSKLKKCCLTIRKLNLLKIEKLLFSLFWAPNLYYCCSTIIRKFLPGLVSHF